MRNPGEEIGGHKGTSLLTADGFRERGAIERMKAEGKNSSFIPYPLAFLRIPLLPRNCESHESRRFATATGKFKSSRFQSLGLRSLEP